MYSAMIDFSIYYYSVVIKSTYINYCKVKLNITIQGDTNKTVSLLLLLIRNAFITDLS